MVSTTAGGRPTLGIICQAAGFPCISAAQACTNACRLPGMTVQRQSQLAIRRCSLAPPAPHPTKPPTSRMASSMKSCATSAFFSQTMSTWPAAGGAEGIHMFAADLGQRRSLCTVSTRTSKETGGRPEESFAHSSAAARCPGTNSGGGMQPLASAARCLPHSTMQGMPIFTAALPGPPCTMTGGADSPPPLPGRRTTMLPTESCRQAGRQAAWQQVKEVC